MCIDKTLFDHKKNKIVGSQRIRQGIGTLSEKTVHAVMKNYYAPDTDMHEIPIENFVADIYTGQEIISKTENLGKVKRRMFLGVARGVKDLDEGTEVFMENEPMGRVIQSDGEHFLFVLTYEYMDSELYVKDVPVEILPLPYEVTVPASVI